MTLFKSFSEIKNDHPCNDDDAKTIYNRSHYAQAELQKLLISLSTGALAVYFLAFTGNKVVVEDCLRIPALIALVSMSVAVLSGIIGWFSEGRRQLYWSLSKSTKDESRSKSYLEMRDRAFRSTMLAMILLIVSFSVGIAASAAFIAMKILN